MVSTVFAYAQDSLTCAGTITAKVESVKLDGNWFVIVLRYVSLDLMFPMEYRIHKSQIDNTKPYHTLERMSDFLKMEIEGFEQ